MTLGARERRLLLLLGVLLVGAVAYRFGPRLFAGDEAGADADAVARAQVARVELPELRLPDATPGEEALVPGRDPFRYGNPPAPPPPPPPKPPTKAELEAMRLQREQEERARLEAERLRQIEAARPRLPAELKYLGSFGPKARRIAVFNDGTSIVNVPEGEILQGRYLVYKIGFESVDLKFVGYPTEPPVRLAAGPGNVPGVP